MGWTSIAAVLSRLRNISGRATCRDATDERKLKMRDETKTISILYMKGVEGNSFYLNDTRIAGPKPWGGGSIIQEKFCSLDDLASALRGIATLTPIESAPPVLSREFLDDLIATKIDNRNPPDWTDVFAVRGAEQLRDAILESLSQEDAR
jgi:hypothetical protein